MIEPLADRLAIILTPKGESAGGIIIPDSYQQPPNTGTIQATGPEVKHVFTGDLVSFSHHLISSAPRYEQSGVTYLLLREQEILCVVERAKQFPLSADK